MRYCSCLGKVQIRRGDPGRVAPPCRGEAFEQDAVFGAHRAGPKVLESGVRRKKSVAEPSGCKHQRTQVIAKDQDAQYVECLDCAEILEADELLDDTTGFDESLSDA